jgi:hypothetical protein
MMQNKSMVEYILTGLHTKSYHGLTSLALELELIRFLVLELVFVLDLQLGFVLELVLSTPPPLAVLRGGEGDGEGSEEEED